MSAYRTPAEVEPMPKVEDPEERRIRMVKEERNRKARATMVITVVPCLLLLAIGWFWNQMSTGLSVTSIIAAIIFSVGNGWAMVIRHDY